MGPIQTLIPLTESYLFNVSGSGGLESAAGSGAGLHLHRADHGDGQPDHLSQGGGGAEQVREAASLPNKIKREQDRSGRRAAGGRDLLQQHCPTDP